MGFFARLIALIKSNLNNLISRAEDPKKMLDQMVHDMQSQLGDAKKQVAVAIADEKRLKKQLDEQEDLAQEWERKAMLALKNGDEDLAREALKRKTEYDRSKTEFLKQWELQKAASEKLKGQLRGLSDKIEDAKRRKNVLVARQKRAEAQKSIQETMQGMSSTSAFDSFDRLAEKVDQIEAEAEATTELGAALEGDSLEDRFKALEATEKEPDAALEALKAKMGLPATDQAKTALPAPSKSD